MKTKTLVGYIFVIDTKTYAGNFERQLCAYCTGITGDCGVGWADQEDFLEEFSHKSDEGSSFATILHLRPDEYGCRRPCKIWTTPGWSSNGMGKHSRKKGKFSAYLSVAIFFRDKPTKEMMKIIRDRSRKYDKIHKVKITGYRLLKEEKTITEIKI